MKYKMRKLFSIFLAVLTLTFLLSVTALAEEPAAAVNIDSFKGGTISLTDAHAGDTFAAYQVVTASRDAATNEINYEWSTTAKTFAVRQNLAIESYQAKTDSELPTLLGQYAAYVKTAGNKITPDVTGTADASGNCKLTVNEPGQYLILATGNQEGAYVYQLMTAAFLPDANYNVPTLCTLAVKSSVPTIDKNVADDTVGVGDTVTYTVDFSVPTYAVGATNSVLTVEDNLPAGLQFVKTTAVTNNGTVLTTGAYTESAASSDKHTWTFNYDMVKNYDTVTITYTCMVTEAIKVGMANTNTAKLIYAGDPFDTDKKLTVSDTAMVYSYGIKVIKSDSKDAGKMLKGVVFEVYKDGKLMGTITTDEKGVAQLMGLDEGAYILKETKAATGYVIGNNTNVEVSIVAGDNKTANEGVKVVQLTNDKANFNLPQTGGTGTWIFTIAGIVLMVTAAAVIFISKKKTNE
ncbi:MAG: SpaH/EbpB family LPXTG-anchored major pilin [Clostridiales bacterium]|nr:SpaH/EbpB family LPXTG-anchored major pilin [Clostridiales bacterium]